MTGGNIRECDGYVMDLSNKRTLSTGVELYRIRATEPRLGGIIPAGTLGGYIASSENLSGTAWVDGTSTIFSASARIADNACVMSGSQIWGFARVGDDAVVRDLSVIADCAVVGNSAIICHSIMLRYSVAIESACLYDSHLDNNSKVTGNSTLFNSSLSGLSSAIESATVINYEPIEDKVLAGHETYRGTRKPPQRTRSPRSYR